MQLRREWFLIFLSPLILVALGVGALNLTHGRAPQQAEDLPGEELYREVMRVAQDHYVIAPDEEGMIYGGAKGMLRSLDPHSTVYSPEEWDSQKVSSRGEYAGIGVVVGRLSGHVSVLEVVPGGPAMASGVRNGDRILGVDGVAVNDRQSIRAITRPLRGERGTLVSLTLQGLDGQEERTVTVERGLAPEMNSYGYMLEREAGVGFAKLVRFRSNTARMFLNTLDRLAGNGMTRLILDLRGNLGGSLDAATDIANLFIDEGVLVTTSGRMPGQQRSATSATPFRNLPLVVLVDGNSASASEVLAGALQDHARAVLVGERTYGKGVVQEVRELRESGYYGGLKITTAHYFTPAGRCIEKEVGLPKQQRRRGGLVPDVPIALSPTERDRNLTLAERGRYLTRIQELLAVNDGIPDDYKDRHTQAASAILRDEFMPDRPLAKAQ